MSGGFSPLLALMNGGSVGGAKEASNVKGSDTGEMRNAFNHNMINDQMFWADYPRPTDISLHAAKEYEAPNIRKMMDIWTLFDDTSPFTRIMPVVQSDNLRVMVQRKVYLPSLTKRNPERVRAHTVEHRNKSYQGVMERLSIMIEIGYPALGTEEGQQIYSMGLQQMRNATLESNVVNMLNTLQTQPGIYRNPGTRYKHVDNGGGPRSLAEALAVEKQMFMIFQKPETAGKAFQLLNALIERIQGPERGGGDTYIMPKKILTYNTLVPDLNTLYLFGGEGAVQRMRSYNPDVGLASDGLGHAIVTFKSFNVEDEPAFDPFTRYVGVSEVCEFGKETSKLRPEEFTSDSENNAIYDIDNDDWAIITPEYVLENSGRFDPRSGNLLSMRSRDIARRSGAAYAEDQKTDTYHYVVEAGGQTIQLPIVEIGLFSPEDFTHDQRRDIAAVATYRMATIRDGNGGINVQQALREGRELIQSIEETPFNAAFLADAAGTTAVSNTASVTSGFSGTMRTTFFAQNEASGWGLPRVPDGSDATYWPSRGVNAPIGYGSAAGILSISKDWTLSGSNAAEFERRHGFPGEIGRKAHAMAVVLNEYAKYAKRFFSYSHAVDPAMCSPWWLKGDERHVLWDNIIATQYRQPYMIPSAGGVAAAPAGGAATAASVKALEDYLIGSFTGDLGSLGDLRAKYAATGAVAVAAAAPARRQANPIGATLTAAGDAANNNTLAVDPDQASAGPITDLNSPAARANLIQSLPLLAQAANGVIKATSTVQVGSAPNSLALRIDRPTQITDVSPTDQAFLIVASAVYLTKAAPIATRYALLHTLAAAAGADVNAATAAANINALYNNVIAPALNADDLITADSTDVNALNDLSTDIRGVAQRFRAYVAANSATVVSPIDSALRLERAVGAASPAAAAGGRFAVSPLVYSPQQLASAEASSAGYFSSAYDPSATMSAEEFASSKEAIASRSLDQIRPSLHPILDYGSYGSVGSTAIVGILTRNSPSGGSATSFGSRALRGDLDADMTDVLGAAAQSEAIARVSGGRGFKRRGAASSGSATIFSADAGFSSASAREDLLQEAASKRTRAAVGQSTVNLLSRLQHAVFRQNWNVAANEESPLINWTRRVIELTAYNLHQLKEWGRRGVEIPRKVHALLFRTFTLGTQTIIKVKSGAIGNQYYGNASYTWALDGISRVFSGQWSYYYGCVPENWENIFHADNVFCSEYLGGGGTIPIGNDDTAPSYEAHGYNEAGKSVYVCLEPPAPRAYAPEISWTGRLSDVAAGWGVVLPPSRRLQFGNAYVFNLMYGMSETQAHLYNAGARENFGYEPGNAPLLAMFGPTKTYDPVTRKHDIVSKPHGYFPLSMYSPGFKAVLKGELLKAPVTNSVTLTAN